MLEQTFMVLGKEYPGSGRPAGFEVVDITWASTTKRLKEGFGYFQIKIVTDKEYNPWNDLTYRDSDGFSQWK